MKFVVRLVVAFLMGCTVAACDGGSPTSPTATTVTPPTTPVPPSGPVQLAELRGFELNAFIPGVTLGSGGGARFTRTVDDSIDFRVELGKVDDYKLVVAIFSSHPADTSVTPEVLVTGLLFFTGDRSEITLRYDSTKCYQGQCYVSLQNRSDKMVPRNDANKARVFGTPGQ